MKIPILVFGILKDVMGDSRISLELEHDSSIKSLKNRLLKEYPDLLRYNTYSVAVNEEYAEDNYKIKNKDVIALIPPVSGG